MEQTHRIATVALNAAIDQTLVIANFSAGSVNRVQSSRLDPGGKAINVASFLADAGQSVTAAGFLGAENDEIFRRLFAQKGIEDRCVRISGATRTSLKITDPVLCQTTDINFPGAAPSAADLERLFATVSRLAATHEWFVLAGRIPPGVTDGIYADLVRALRGRRAVVDTSGEALRLALSAGPSVIKPNVEELAELTGESLSSPQAILAAGRGLVERYGIGTVVVSMGKDGAVFVERDEALLAVPPAVEVKSTVGAGDAMVAGIVVAKLRGLSLPQCARLATAFSITAIARTGHSLPPIPEVEAALGSVRVTEVAA